MSTNQVYVQQKNTGHVKIGRKLSEEFRITQNQSTMLTLCSSWCDGSSDRSFMVDPLSYVVYHMVNAIHP